MLGVTTSHAPCGTCGFLWGTPGCPDCPAEAKARLCSAEDTPQAFIHGVGECLGHVYHWRHQQAVARFEEDDGRVGRYDGFAEFWLDAIRS